LTRRQAIKTDFFAKNEQENGPDNACYPAHFYGSFEITSRRNPAIQLIGLQKK
jgi:hypothetical protein